MKKYLKKALGWTILLTDVGIIGSISGLMLGTSWYIAAVSAIVLVAMVALFAYSLAYAINILDD